MIIEEKDFRLTPVGKDSLYWDLELQYIVNKGKTNERIDFKNAGYGLTLEKALTIVAHARICNKYENQSISLKTYIKEFKQIKEEIEKICTLSINCSSEKD